MQYDYVGVLMQLKFSNDVLKFLPPTIGLRQLWAAKILARSNYWQAYSTNHYNHGRCHRFENLIQSNTAISNIVIFRFVPHLRVKTVTNEVDKFVGDKWLFVACALPVSVLVLVHF